MNSVKSPYQQQGAVLVLTAISLLVLMGMAGLAIDIGRAMVDKTIQQNAADAAVLSAAIRLSEHNDPLTPTDEQAAEAAGKATYGQFVDVASQGNGEIAAKMPDSDLNFTFAHLNDISVATQSDWEPASDINDANFVRVATNPMTLNTWFAGVVGTPELAVSSSTIAGNVPIAPCNLAPIMLCAENPSSPDTDCSDGACYGYTLNNIYCLTPSNNSAGTGLKCAASGNTAWGPGNIGYVDLGSVFPDLSNGANTLGKCLAGDPGCQNYCEYTPNLEELPPEPGDKWGPVRDGIERIFNKNNNVQYAAAPTDTITGLTENGPVTNSAGQSSTLTYLDWNKISTFTNPPVTQIPTAGLPLSTLTSNGVPSPFAVYQTFAPPATPNKETLLPANSKYKQRVLNIPFVDCSTPPNGASDTVPLVGFGCFFVTAKAEKQANEVFILGQLMSDQSLCMSTGRDVSGVDSTFHKVILYKDALGGHS